MAELEAQFRVGELDHGVPTTFDEGSFAGLVSLTLVTRLGFLDVAFIPDGTDGYDDLVRAGEEREVLGTRVVVAALSDIIRSKEAARRPKDLDALPELRRLSGNE